MLFLGIGGSQRPGLIKNNIRERIELLISLTSMDDQISWPSFSSLSTNYFANGFIAGSIAARMRFSGRCNDSGIGLADFVDIHLPDNPPQAAIGQNLICIYYEMARASLWRNSYRG